MDIPITEGQSNRVIVRDKRGRLMVRSIAKKESDCKTAFLTHYPDIHRGYIHTWEDAEKKGYYIEGILITRRKD